MKLTSSNQSPAEQRAIADLIEGSNVLRQTAYSLAPDIVTVAEHIINTLHNGGKVLTCGNGGSAADAQHFAAELVGRSPVSATTMALNRSLLARFRPWDGQAISW